MHWVIWSIEVLIGDFQGLEHHQLMEMSNYTSGEGHARVFIIFIDPEEVGSQYFRISDSKHPVLFTKASVQL